MSTQRPSPTTRQTRPRRLALLCLLCALLAPSMASAYVIYFLDGSQVDVREPYTIQGERALVTKLSGEQTTIDLTLIDQEKTARNNVGRLSDVVVIDTSGTRPFTLGAGRDEQPTTLREAIRSGQVRARDLTSEANNGDESGISNANANLPLTRGGFPDLEQMLRDPLDNPDLEGNLNSSLRALGVAKFRLYKGTGPGRLMVEVSADGRYEVFQQLEALGNAHGLAADAGNFNALEVLMLTKQRARSAQFVLTKENVPLLTNGILTPSEFFIQYVQF